MEREASITEEVAALEREILAIGALVENAVDVAVASFLQADGDLAAAATGMDVEIDRREVEIEKQCLRLLKTHRPRGEDLRFVAGVLKINAKLERMADLAVNIAEEAIGLASHRAAPPTVDLQPLSDLSQRMVRKGIDALVTRDPDLAKRVCDMDDEADRLYADLHRAAVRRMQEDPTQIDGVTSILGALRDLERIADQATNVGEDVVFMVEGEIIRHRGSGSGRGTSFRRAR